MRHARWRPCLSTAEGEGQGRCERCEQLEPLSTGALTTVEVGPAGRLGETLGRRGATCCLRLHACVPRRHS